MAPAWLKFTVLFSSICTALASTSTYTLYKDFNASSPAFFDNFRFFTDPDPTYGAVQYVNKATALQQGLIKSTGGQTYIGVDHTNQYPGDGSKNRTSVRIESHELFTRGLFVVDLANMPGGICGTWPAWWFFGNDSPTPLPTVPTGEIDVIENINEASVDTSTLYAYNTAGICSTNNYDNITYGQREPDTNGNTNIVQCNGGPQFNVEGGGVYALQWTSERIRVFFIPRAEVMGGDGGPLGQNPNPDTWGEPSAEFGGFCDLNSYFRKLYMIFNVTFCGYQFGAGGQSWTMDPVCSTLTPTCEMYVAQNPSAFRNAYWLINSVKYYQNGE